MVFSKQRVRMALEIDNEDLPQLRANMANPKRDRGGSACQAVAMTLRSRGMARYLLGGDVAGFRSDVAESAAIHLSLFDRYDKGEREIGQGASMIQFWELFDALASANAELSLRFAERMGGRLSIEAEQDSQFILSMGYTLKSIVLKDGPLLDKWLPLLTAELHEPSHRDYAGYVDVVGAIRSHDLRAAQSGFAHVVRGHERQTRSGGTFNGTLDENLCMWGIGMANLCRWRGLPVGAIPPLIPADLLVGCGQELLPEMSDR